MIETKIQTELPRYRSSHKEVWALHIAAVEHVATDGSAKITPYDEGYAPFRTRPCWLHEFGHPDSYSNGYYVVYEGGFSSWLPENEFKRNYTRI